jgi:indole-3-glycerol phosphate synthase
MNILEKIVEKKKERLAQRKTRRSIESFERTCGPVRPFFSSGLTLITECKKGSPSKGIMVEDYNPLSIAQSYYEGGSNALSILTEEDFFFGSDDHLVTVRAHVELPVLRKDFIIDSYQIYESHAIGADAILLIAAILDDGSMREFAQIASSLGLAVLAEAHDEHEVERILAVENAAVGVNARDLRDFSIDLRRVVSIRKMIPADRIAVAESGIHTAEDAVMLRDAGYNAFLIGERFVKEKDPSDAVRKFSCALNAS